MAFPLSPANNQTALVNGIVYQWNATLGVWKRNGSVNSIEVGQLLLNSAQQSTTNGSGTLIVSGGAGITGNVYTGGIFITGSANGITFADGSTQTSAGASAATGAAAYDAANTAASTATAANNLAGSAYGQANASFTQANAAFSQANAANQYANSAYAKANTVATDLANFSSLYAGIEATQNTRITNAETNTQAAFDKANSANVLAQASFDTANGKFASSGGTISGDTVVTGNLTVTGTTFYANTTNLTVEDNIITLNSNVTGAPTLSAGIEVNRGSSSNTELLWLEANTSWEFTNDGTFYDKIAGLTYANAAFAAANTNASDITILQGVNTTQNTDITTADTKAQAAFDKANTSAAVTITDDTTNSGTYYPLLSVSTTGTLSTSNTSSSKLSYVPSTGTLTTVDLNTTSDIKFKDDVQPIDSALEMINRIDGVSFSWKETGKKSYGVIAQQLQKVLPELVSQEERGLSVSYLPIIAILIEAIKEQQKQINDLKK